MKKAKLLLPVLAAAGAYAVGSQALFSVASRRDSRWLQLPKKEKADEYESLVSSFRARMAEKEMTDLTIYSRDGLKLTAHWYPAQDAKRTIVLVHGWRSAWYRDFAGIAEDLHDGGANLLFIEQRAHSASEGEYISYGLMERYDVADWACRAAEFAGSALPMYLFGVSMGASTVMMASALPHKRRADASAVSRAGREFLHAPAHGPRLRRLFDRRRPSRKPPADALCPRRRGRLRASFDEL